MYRINNIKLQIEEKEEILMEKVAKKINITPNDFTYFEIQKKSLDSRKKNNIHWTYNINFQTNKKVKNKLVTEVKIPTYTVPNVTSNHRPIIIGLGPAGLMAGLILSEAGLKPIIIEKGKDVYARQKDIEEFWKNGKLNKNSNVQFGAGGAGTFSDGKLTTGVKDERRIKLIEEFISAGAPKEIKYLAKPHVGTDILMTMVDNMCKKIIKQGGEIRYNSEFVDFEINDHSLKNIIINDLINNEKYTINAQHVILALGHSSRNSFELLYDKGIDMKAKPFSVGVRIEHKREDVNVSQYGNQHINLGAADYKLNTKTSEDIGVYTFCMCPGGAVVASASEENRLVTNGMSYYARDLENSNSALLVSITPDDFDGSANPLNGIYFQRKLEEDAFIAGGSNYFAPVQRVGDFLNNKPTVKFGKVLPSYSPGTKMVNLHEVLPAKISQSLHEAIISLSSKVNFMKDEDAILTAIESRSSSPITILRDEKKMTNIYGIYPCGEGAGYAGGIVSAGIDGIRCAEHVIEELS